MIMATDGFFMYILVLADVSTLLRINRNGNFIIKLILLLMSFLYIFVLADVYPIKKLHFCILFPQSMSQKRKRILFLHMLYSAMDICDKIYLIILIF